MFSLQQQIGTVIGGFDFHAIDIMNDMTYSKLMAVWRDNGFPAWTSDNTYRIRAKSLDFNMKVK